MMMRGDCKCSAQTRLCFSNYLDPRLVDSTSDHLYFAISYKELEPSKIWVPLRRSRTHFRWIQRGDRLSLKQEVLVRLMGIEWKIKKTESEKFWRASKFVYLTERWGVDNVREVMCEEGQTTTFRAWFPLLLLHWLWRSKSHGQDS